MQWFLLGSLVEGLDVQIFKTVSVHIHVNASEHPLLYAYVKMRIHTCIYTPAAFTATVKANHMYAYITE